MVRAEPWYRTTPYELDVRHALFTLVPLIKPGGVSVPPGWFIPITKAQELVRK
jgi:hypothetical protein